MLVKQGESHDGKGFELYKTKAAEGLLYEHIRDKIEATTGKKIENRKLLKEAIFTVLFTDNRFIGQPEAEPKRIFRDIFPLEYEAFSIIKKRDKTVLPCLLQRIESKLVLDRIAKRISKEHSEMPLFTIHDSVICPLGLQEYVGNVMKEEMQKAIGITPTVGYDFWSPDNIK